MGRSLAMLQPSSDILEWVGQFPEIFGITDGLVNDIIMQNVGLIRG